MRRWRVRRDYAHFSRARVSPELLAMACQTVFIVSGDPRVRDSVSVLAASAGLRVEKLLSLEAWLGAAKPSSQACLILDSGEGDLVGPARLARLASACARIPVLVLTEPGDVPTAVHAIRQGAADVLQKPFRDEKLLECIRRAVAENGSGYATSRSPAPWDG